MSSVSETIVREFFEVEVSEEAYDFVEAIREGGGIDKLEEMLTVIYHEGKTAQ